MGFPIFSNEILDSIPSHLRLKSFAAKNIQNLMQLNQYRHELQFFYRNHLDAEQHRKRLTKSIEKLNSRKFKLDMRKYCSEARALKHHANNVALQKFMEENPWQKWKIIGTKRISILKLSKFWELTKKTNLLTSEALMVLAKEIVPSYENFVQLAYQEIKLYKPSLSSKLIANLKDYLRSCDDFLSEERKTTCDAMLARLKVVAETKKIVCDDVNYYVVSSLRTLGVSCYERKHGMQNNFTEQQFRYFHRYILKYGNDQQKQKLMILPWLREDLNFRSETLFNKLVIIPRELSGQIIQWKWPKWFWSFVDPRRTFFDEKFYLLSKIRLYRCSNFSDQTLPELISGESWHPLCKLEKDLLEEEQEIHVNLTSRWTKTFRPFLCKFYQQWSQTLRATSVKILFDKINYARLLAEQIRTRITFGIDLEIIFNDKARTFVSEIVADIESHRSELKNSGLQEVWEKCKGILKVYFGRDLRKKELGMLSGNTQVVYPVTDKNKNLVSVITMIKSIYYDLTPNNIFDLSLLEKKLSQWQLLIIIEASQIKTDFEFWKNFYITYINTCIVLGVEHPLMQKLWILMINFGHKQLNYVANNFLNNPDQERHKYYHKCQLLITELQSDLNSVPKLS